LNLYAFVGNDGVNQWDYLGLSGTAISTFSWDFPPRWNDSDWDLVKFNDAGGDIISDLGARVATLRLFFYNVFADGIGDCFCQKNSFQMTHVARLNVEVEINVVKIKIPIVVGGGSIGTAARIGQFLGRSTEFVEDAVKKNAKAEDAVQKACEILVKTGVAPAGPIKLRVHVVTENLTVITLGGK
jgi:hypothetical protein